MARFDINTFDNAALGSNASAEIIFEMGLAAASGRDRDVDLIEEHHVIGLVANKLLGLGPGRLGHFNIPGFVLCFPGKAFAHCVKCADIREMRIYEVTLTSGHPAFDELHDGAFHVMGDAAKDHPECGRGLALPFARIDDD